LDGRIEKGDATRARLVATATRAFAEAGYEATSIEAILARSGVSRGALYHHFDDKQSLFRAVLEAVETQIADTILKASAGVSDPIAALQAGCKAWLQLARDRTVKQIVLVDAPAVLGWETWREIDSRFGFGMLKAALENAAQAGYVQRNSVDVLAHMLLAATLEIALLVARAPNPPAMSRLGERVLHETIDKLLSNRKRPRSRG
jgi:AcrR family transcriptional regulator